MADELIFHIGTHKTGSTAIQKTLFENSAALELSHTLYPQVGFCIYGHHGIAEAADRKDNQQIEILTDKINRLPGRVVISSENFSRCSRDGIMHLKEKLNVPKVRVVCYVRNLLDIVPIWWKELLKHDYTCGLPEFLASCMVRPFSVHVLNPSGIVDGWAAVFGRGAIEIYLYDEIEDTAHHFMTEVLKLPAYEKLAEFKWINVSFDYGSAELVRVLNTLNLKGVEILMRSEPAKILAKQLLQKSDPFLKSIRVDYDSFIFQHIERGLLRNWHDRIIGLESRGRVFRKRVAWTEFIDCDFWIYEIELAKAVRALADASRVSSAR